MSTGRRHTASPVACFVNVPLASVNQRPGEIDMYVNAFDQPEDFAPGLHGVEAADVEEEARR